MNLNLPVPDQVLGDVLDGIKGKILQVSTESYIVTSSLNGFQIWHLFLSFFYSCNKADLDYRFHRLLAKTSGNQTLVSLLDRVFDRMQLLRIQTTNYNPDVLEIRTEHRRIYEPIKEGNTEAAVRAIAEHLRASNPRNKRT